MEDQEFFAKPKPTPTPPVKPIPQEPIRDEDDDSAFFEKPAPAPAPARRAKRDHFPTAPAAVIQSLGQRGRGRVVRWVRSYGYIQPDGGGQQLWFHQTSLIMDGFRTVNEGTPAIYRSAVSTKGPVAIEVEVIDEKNHEPKRI